MDTSIDLDHRISGIAVLDQPLPRDLYRLLSERDGWLSRDEAAEALGVARSVAAFHLDKLAEAGIVDVRFERTFGRTEPGAGRPAKLFRRRHDELSASVPDRHYELAGFLLAAGVADAMRTGLFHRLAEQERPLVCEMNLDFVNGIIDGTVAAVASPRGSHPSAATAVCAPP